MASLLSSSSSSSSSSTFDMAGFFKSLECPVEGTLLTRAVSCVPCMHKINEKAAQTLYGTMSGNACSNANQRCVTCRTIVTAYYVDHAVRDIAMRLIGDNKNKLAEELPTSPLVLEARQEEKEQKKLDYPGKAAKFLHSSGDWSYFNHGYGSQLRYIMTFCSSNPDSLIQEFSLLGDADGKIRLSVSYLEQSRRELNQYLLSFDIPCRMGDMLGGCFVLEGHTNVKKIFSIIAKHNEIPVDYFEKLRAIVERGTP